MPEFQAGRKSAERLLRTDCLPDISPAKLMRIVDLAFEHYLEQEMAAVPAESFERKMVCAWQDLISRRPLSRALQEVFGSEIDFSDARPLADKELIRMLARLGDLGDAACERYGMDHRYMLRHHIENSPLAAALNRAFGETEQRIVGVGAYCIYRFFNQYLLKEYFFREGPPSAAELKEQRHFELEMGFRCVVEDLCAALGIAAETDEERKVVLHNLMDIAQTAHDDAALERFIELLEAIDDPKLLERKGAFAVELERILREAFPAQFRSSIAEEKYRLVILGPKEKGRAILHVVPLSNFYFHPDEDQGPAENIDWASFPPSAHMEPSERCWETLVAGVRDVSVFDPTGMKVFWGDLPKSCLPKLAGPLYVLSQSDSYHDIPAWAVIASQEAKDPHRPQALIPLVDEPFPKEAFRIDTLYMRLVALGKIEGGRYYPNNGPVGPGKVGER